MQLFVYQAECGDAARLRYLGEDGKYHNIFLDSGYSRTFRGIIGKEIRDLEGDDEVIDLWLVSHIHDDHIGGVLSYIKAIECGGFNNIVSRWLYNPPKKETLNNRKQTMLSISDAKSIAQGNNLTKYLLKAGQLPAECITNAAGIIDIKGLRMTILSPSKESLKELHNKYIGNLDRDSKGISEAKSPCQSDYHIKVDAFNLGNWKENDSIENGSSISLLIEQGDEKILWLSDSFPGIVLQKLKEIGYSDTNPLICDIVKISHHGSAGNTNNELLDIIRCNNYLISANGENNHCLPNKECISRILRNRNRATDSRYKIYYTHDNMTLRGIFNVDGNEVFEKYNFDIIYNSTKRFNL